MANTLRELTDGYALNQLKLIANQFSDIGRLNNQFNNSFILPNELFAANKAAIQLKNSLANAYNVSTGNINLTEFSKQLKLTGQTLPDFAKNLGMIGAQGTKAFTDLARTIALAEKPLLGTSKVANQLWGTLGNTVKWQASSALVQGILKDVASATSYVKSLDNSLNSIQIVTNHGAEYMANFAKSANEAAKSLHTTTNEYAKAALIYYQQGLSDKAVQDRVATTIKLANVSGQSAKVVSDQLTAVWNNFYNGSKNLEFYADAMAALGATTASSSSEIAKGLEKFAAIADSTGLSFEYASSALATVVANTRQSADSVGTSFRTLFSRLQGLNLGQTLDDGTTLNKYSKALLSVGVNIKQANGELKNMDSILNELGDKWQSLAQDEKVALAQTIGGARNYTGLMSLMDNWDDFTKNLKTAQTAQGTLQNQAEIYAESWEAATARVRAATETLYSNLLDDKTIKGIVNTWADALNMVGGVTNNLGGFGGTSALLLNIGTRLFQNQLTKGANNLGLTLSSITTSGRDEIDALQRKAFTTLTKNVTISSNDEINEMYKKQMQDLQAAQYATDRAITAGRIAKYEQPIYQQLLNNVANLQSDALQKTIASADIRSSQKNDDTLFLKIARNNIIRQGHFWEESGENARALQQFDQDKTNAQNAIQTARQTRDNTSQTIGRLLTERESLRNTQPQDQAQRDAITQRIAAINNTLHGTVQADGTRSGGLLAVSRNQNQQVSTAQSRLDSIIQQEALLRETIAARDPNSEILRKGGLLDTRFAAARTEASNLANMRSLLKSFGSDLTSNSGMRTAYQTIRQMSADKTNSEYFLKLLGGPDSDLGKQFTALSKQVAQVDLKGNIDKQLNNIFSGKNGTVGLGTFVENMQDRAASASYEATKALQDVDRYLKLGDKKDPAIIGLRNQIRETLKNGPEGLVQYGEDGRAAAQLLYGAGKINQKEYLRLARASMRHVTGGEGIVSGAQIMSSVGMTVNAMSNAFTTLKNDSATTAQKISALGIAAGTVGNSVVVLGQNMSTFWDKQAKSFTNVGKNTLFTMGTAALIFGAIKGYQTYQNNYGSEGKVKALNADLALQRQATSESRENFEQFDTIIKTYNQSLETIKSTVAGTSDYFVAQANANEIANNLIQKYGLVYGQDYSIDDGTLTINQLQQNAIQKKAEDTYINDVAIESVLTQLKNYEEASRMIELREQTLLKEHVDNKVSAAGEINGERGIFNTAKALWAQGEVLTDDYLGIRLHNEDIIARNRAEIQNQLDTDSRIVKAQGQQQLALSALAETILDTQLSKQGISVNDFIRTGFLSDPQLQDTLKEIIEEVEQATIDDQGFIPWNDIISKISGKGITGITLPDNTEITKNEDLWTLLKQEGYVIGEMPEEASALESKIKGALPAYLLKDYIDNFIQDYSDISNQFKDFKSLTSNDFSELINSELQGQEHEAIRASLITSVSNIQSDLLAALSSNIDKDWLTSNNLLESDEFKNLIQNYSLNQLQDISDYIIASGTVFGNKTAQTIFSQLSTGQNIKTLQQLSKVNWDSTFSALGDINKLARNLGGHDNIYSEVLRNAIDELGAEGGIFEQLYNSSGFSKVLDNLTAQFDTMGEITTGYVVKLSQKNEELNSVLSLGASGYTGLNINAAGLASAFNLINSGKLTREQMTSGVLSSLSTTHQLEAEKYRAFDVVDNQDLGRSGTDLLEYFSNAQKAYINAKSQDLTYDTPLQNIFRTLMPTYVRDAYIEANQGGNGLSFTQIMDSDKIPDSVKEFLGHTNKKGTKPVTTWSEVLDMYGGFIHDSDLTGNEAWKALGFDPNNLPELRPDQQAYFDKNGYTLETIANAMFGIDFSQGNLWLNDTTGNNTYGYNTKQTIDNITKIFATMMPKEQAQNLAQIFTAHVGESSGGTILQENDAKTAVEDLKRQEPTSSGRRMYSQAALDAIWWENSYFYNQMYQGKTEEERKAAFIKDIVGENGLIAPSLDTDFWKDNKGNGLIKGISEAYAGANGWTMYDENAVFNRLLRDFGVTENRDPSSKIDFNKLQELVTFLGGTDQDLQNLIDNNADFFKDRTNATFIDKFGIEHNIEKTDDETTQKYIERITREQNAANNDTFSYIDKNNVTQQIYDPLGIYRRNFHQDDEGNVTWGHTDENGQWVEGPDPNKQVVGITVDQEGNILGLGQTGQILRQGKDGTWLTEEEFQAAQLADKSTEVGFNALTEDKKREYIAELKQRQSNNETTLTDDEKNILEKYGKDYNLDTNVKGNWEDLPLDVQESLISELNADNIRGIWDSSSDEMKRVLWDRMGDDLKGELQYQWDKENYEAKDEDGQREIQNAILEAVLNPNPKAGPLSEFGRRWLETEEGKQALANASQAPYVDYTEEDYNNILGKMYSGKGEELTPEEQAAIESETGRYYEEKYRVGQMSDLERTQYYQRLYDNNQAGIGLTKFQMEALDAWNQGIDLFAPTPEEFQRLQQQQAYQQFSYNALQAGDTDAFITSDATLEEKKQSRILRGESVAALQDLIAAEAAGEDTSEYQQKYDEAKEKADLYAYQNTMSPAERLAAITDAKNILDNQGADKLTPFQKFLMQSIGELVDYNGIMAEAAEGEEGSGGKKKQAHVDEETGELVDEDGNEIEMPEGSQPTGGSTGGRESGKDTWVGPGGGSNKSDNAFTNATDIINSMIQNGNAPGVGDTVSYVDPSTGATVTHTVEEQDLPSATAASGQNNAHLLTYASGKEGHIAVTGELGPELRIKSDGSMDILGKKGREYAWVEPDDRIYTAQQSAGILKSNKIPGLEGLANGINNYLPGYAAGEHVGGTDHTSSGSGGGGGGGGSRSRGGGAAAEKDPRYDPQTLKIRDILERYYTILQQIDNITKAVERFSKVADRAWGRERIRAIEHQNELQQKQYEAQKKYIAEIEGYLETDQSTMTTMIKEFVDGWNKAVDENTDPNNTMEKISWAGAQFDQDGVLTNYRDFVEKLVEQYNQNAASANQETQYKFQEQLKDIQMYTDTLNLYEEQINALEDIKNAILDTAVKVVTYEVEYKLELSGDTDRILNFQADKYKDDVYQAAKYLELLDQRADLTRKNLETVTEGIMKTLGNYAGENMRVGALHTLDELGIYGTNKFEIPEELLEELDEEDEEDAEKLKELQAERSRNITKQIGAWIDEAYATNKDEVEKIEKMLSFSSEEGAGDFTYDENWRDTYDSWEDYYNEVINKTDNDTERFIDNYEEIIGKLNGLVDFQKVRAQISDWLEELRTKDAEAAAEIDKIVRYTEDGQIANYSDVLEKLNEANVKLNDDAIQMLYTDQDKFFEMMSDFSNNPGWVDFTTEHKDQLTNWMDAIYQYLESLQDTYEQTIEQLGDSVKATSKQMDSAIDEFDYYESVYKEFKNIVDLTNREMTDITKGYFDALNSKSMDNAINKIKGTVTNYHLLQSELEEITRQYEEMQARANAATGEEQIFLQQSADRLKEQMDIANSQFEDAHKNYLSAWEDALNKMSEIYKNTLEEASKEFEKSFSPLFNTLALLQAQFDREKALGDLYVDNYQRIHDLNKLNRDIQLSIDDTDNLKGKERLRDLQAEINQLQEDGTELSEYDLDILDKKYKLELARQALEDAKDAKSMVRLARDNNGNWSYVYTANQDDVDKAEQDYEDAIREMEQANEDYIDNIQDQILQVQQEAQQAILALQPEDFATYEDYLTAVNNIQNSMYQTLDFLRSQLNNAFGNNEWLDPYIVNRYGINNHDLTTDFGDTTLAKLLDNDDLDKSINHMRDNFENNLMSPALEAFLTYSQKQQQVYEAAEHNMATIGEDFGKEMEYVAKMSDNEVQIVEKLSDRVQTAFEDMANVVDEKTAKHIAEMDKLVNLYEKLVEAITRVKELSGENLPIEGGQFIGKIDSWAEIQRLNKELAEHGDYRVLEDLTDLDPEDLQDRKDAMEKATEKIGEWMEALLTDAVDEETKTAIQDMVEKDENGLITNYKQVISKLAQIEKTDENKDTLKEIKKWRATEQKAMYTSPRQVYKENEGLYTNFVAGDQFTKDYISWVTDQLMYKQMRIASEDGVTDTERADIETYFSSHGGVWIQKGDTEEFFDNWTDLQAWLEKNKYVPPSDDGGSSGGADTWWWNVMGGSGGTANPAWWVDTGGYTGRWQSADTGMYTGEWPDGSVRRNGKLAWLHQKELVLNAHDTENFLDAIQIVRQLDNLTNWMANGLGDLMVPNVQTENSELEQNVHIDAEFPNVIDHNEIEQAFNNLVNMASQYANRK